MSETIRVGVVGVGSMGTHHARVYSELTGVNLVGVTDVDEQQARDIAERFDTTAHDRETLFEVADAVSVAVPTHCHRRIGMEAIETDTHLLVEKPFVSDTDEGEELIAAARDRDLVLQVGHVERYNPAITALQDVLVNVDPIAIAARRQGPPVDRDGNDSVVFDLMIHDIDIVCAVSEADVASVSAIGVADNNHVVAQIKFEDGLAATMTASRITQERIRDLAITAEECQVDVDYMNQSVQIHRHSLPEYVATGGDVRYRHESIIERPTVQSGEPLKNELSEFVDTIRKGEKPRTTGADGLRAVELANRIEEAATRSLANHSMEVPNP
jgi:predicted dehydrogenase